MLQNQLGLELAPELVDIQAVGEAYPIPGAIVLVATAEADAFDGQTDAILGAQVQAQVLAVAEPLAAQDPKDAIEEGLREALAPGSGMAQGLGGGQVEGLGRQFAIGEDFPNQGGVAKLVPHRLAEGLAEGLQGRLGQGSGRRPWHGHRSGR